MVSLQCDGDGSVYAIQQVGTCSFNLCNEAIELHLWRLRHNVRALAVHCPGLTCLLADFLFRNRRTSMSGCCYITQLARYPVVERLPD